MFGRFPVLARFPHCLRSTARPAARRKRSRATCPIHTCCAVNLGSFNDSDLCKTSQAERARRIEWHVTSHPLLLLAQSSSLSARQDADCLCRFVLDQGPVNAPHGILLRPGRKEFAMCSSSRLEQATAANIGRMMGRLGIDMAYAALPRYGLSFSSVLRACNSCTARAQCAQWMADTRHTAFGPPKFCASADLLWELLWDPAIGHRPQSVQ